MKRVYSERHKTMFHSAVPMELIANPWKRLIQSVKKHIQEVLKKLSQRTIVKSRNLTQISTNPNDFQVLTLNGFLIEPSNRSTESCRDNNSKLLVRKWKITQKFTK